MESGNSVAHEGILELSRETSATAVSAPARMAISTAGSTAVPGRAGSDGIIRVQVRRTRFACRFASHTEPLLQAAYYMYSVVGRPYM